MTALQSIILGIVEGITEYLPISSTGHLILAERAMGIPHDTATDAFTICIQAGAILAVIALYWNRIIQMFLGLMGKSAAGLRLVLCLLVAFLPAAVLGLAFSKLIKKELFNLPMVSVAWFVGGVAILVVGAWAKKRPERQAGKEIEDLTLRGAFLIGLIQCLALWPGTSRSLVTIVGGLVVGLTTIAAVEFSFLLGLITLTAATAYDGYKHGAVMLHTFGWQNLALGTFAAWLSAMIAVKWMVTYLKSKGLEIFGWYRIVLAIVVVALIVYKVLPADIQQG